MIVGETVEIVRTETRETVFSVSSASALVSAPDGSAPTALTVTASPGLSLSLSQSLSAILTPAQGGEYLISWSYLDSLGQTIYRIDKRFACFTDAHSLALERLQCSRAELSAQRFEREMASVALSLLLEWPQIGNGIRTIATEGVYNLLAGSDQQLFDEAAALLVCSRLIGPLMSGGAASDLTMKRDTDFQAQFSQVDGNTSRPGSSVSVLGIYDGSNERKRWLAEAATLVGRISVVKLMRASMGASFSPFAVGGPTRSAHRHGEPNTILGQLERALGVRDVFGGAGN
jgi:hypothetical protein